MTALRGVFLLTNASWRDKCASASLFDKWLCIATSAGLSLCRSRKFDICLRMTVLLATTTPYTQRIHSSYEVCGVGDSIVASQIGIGPGRSTRGIEPDSR